MKIFDELFGTSKPIIGVIHLLPLPGSSRWDGRAEQVFLRAEQEAAALASGGVHGIIVENCFDAPFTKNRIDAATVSAFTVAVKRVMSVTELPIGINVLRNDGLTALAIAAGTGAKFIRINVYVGAMVTDQGLIEGNAHELQVYRKSILAEKQIKIFADVMVKHAVPVSPLADITSEAQDAVERGLADAIIVTGTRTGDSAKIEDLRSVKEAVPNTPVLVGSGVSKENIGSMLAIADGAIIATAFKRQGLIENPIDVERVRTLLSLREPLRSLS